MSTTLFRLAFWAALVVTLWFAWYPAPPTLLSSDKWQHMLAFAVLTTLYFLAYPKVRWITVFASMAALGALIEVVQAIPFIHRDADVHDWYADMSAIVVTMILVAVVRRIWPRSGSVAG